MRGKPEILNNNFEVHSNAESDAARNPLSSHQEFVRGTTEDVELPKAEDGYINLVAYVPFPTTISRDWKMREGGVLYMLGEYGDFFNSMIGYHKSAKKTYLVSEIPYLKS